MKDSEITKELKVLFKLFNELTNGRIEGLKEMEQNTLKELVKEKFKALKLLRIQMKRGLKG
jgi:hypothetical protein